MTITQQQLEALSRIAHSPARYVIGIDEVGVGALAGPIYVAGAVFEKGWGDPDVKDSKRFVGKNAHKNRHRVLVTKILPSIAHQTICIATTKEIDADGAGPTLTRLTRQAVLNCLVAFNNSVVVLDGTDHQLVLKGTEIIQLAKADVLVPAVSAASIIAKTSRDDIMEIFDEQYPWYGFRKNRGYGSIQHLAALSKMGICPLHRRSYSVVRRLIAATGPT